MRTLLNINFWRNNVTEDDKIKFMVAVDHEKFCMELQDCDNSILRKEKAIKSLAEKLEEAAMSAEYNTIMGKITGYEADLAELKGLRDKLIKSCKDTEETYNSVVDEMSKKNENGFGNDKDAVRTVLRVLASWDNSRLQKYAIIPAFESPELYNALEEIHIRSKAGEDGQTVMSKEVKEAYKKASDDLERIIKVTFSLPFATKYTEKTRVKLTAQDKKLLHDCYIKGFKNKFEEDEDGTVNFKKRVVNTLVKVKKDKKTREITVDYSGLATCISDIVLKHYFA